MKQIKKKIVYFLYILCLFSIFFIQINNVSAGEHSTDKVSTTNTSLNTFGSQGAAQDSAEVINEQTQIEGEASPFAALSSNKVEGEIIPEAPNTDPQAFNKDQSTVSADSQMLKAVIMQTSLNQQTPVVEEQMINTNPVEPNEDQLIVGMNQQAPVIDTDPVEPNIEPINVKDNLAVGLNELNEFYHSTVLNYIENINNLQGFQLNYKNLIYFNLNIGVNNRRIYFNNSAATELKINKYFSEFCIANIALKFSDQYKWSINSGMNYNHSFSEDGSIFSKKDSLFVGHAGTNFDINLSNLFKSSIGYVYTANLNNKIAKLQNFKINHHTIFINTKHNFIINNFNHNTLSFFIHESALYNNFNYSDLYNNSNYSDLGIKKESESYFSAILNLGLNQKIITLANNLTLNLFTQLKGENTLDFINLKNKRITYIYIEIGLKFNLYKSFNFSCYFSKELRYKKNNSLEAKVNFEF